MTLWALGIYFVLVLLLVTAMLLVSYVLGQRHHEKATDSPYESGIVSTGSAHVRLSAKFYLVAMFFVVVDLEAAFIFAWAVAGRELGWPGGGGDARSEFDGVPLRGSVHRGGNAQIVEEADHAAHDQNDNQCPRAVLCGLTVLLVSFGIYPEPLLRVIRTVLPA